MEDAANSSEPAETKPKPQGKRLPHPGQLIAYESGPKRCRVGRVQNVSTTEQVVTVHEYTARAGDRLRVHWEPTYYQPGVGLQQLEGQPVLATMNLSKCISVMELNSGVMGHAAARKLERAGWRLDEAVLQDGALVGRGRGTLVRAGR